MARNPHSVLEEPALTAPPRGKKSVAQEVRSEPALQASMRERNALEHEVWSEPGLLAGCSASDPSRTLQGMLKQHWQHTSWGRSWLCMLVIACAAGPFALLAAFLKTSTPSLLIAALIMAPLVEELGKVCVPLMLMERRPYLFQFGLQPVLVCVVSGLVFASVENLLYIQVYAREQGPDYAMWRWSVCTMLHAGCSLVAGLGLRRSWLAARKAQSLPDLSAAAPYFIAAMVIHGSYNGLMVCLQATHLLFFPEA